GEVGLAIGRPRRGLGFGLGRRLGLIPLRGARRYDYGQRSENSGGSEDRLEHAISLDYSQTLEYQPGCLWVASPLVTYVVVQTKQGGLDVQQNSYSLLLGWPVCGR